jgi:hypothetical protein
VAKGEFEKQVCRFKELDSAFAELERKSKTESGVDKSGEE